MVIMKFKMTATVMVRLTRPPGPGVYVPWCKKVGFSWKDHTDVALEADTIEHLAYLTRHHADKLHRTWPAGDLEAVKVEGNVWIEGTELRIHTFDDRRET